MSLGAGSMNLFLPAIERLSRLPGKALVAMSGVGNGLLLLVGWMAGQRHGGFGGWLPFSVGVALTAVLVIFALRRHQLESRLDAYSEAAIERYNRLMNPPRNAGEISAAAGEGVVIDQDGVVIPGPNSEAMRQEAELLKSRDRQRAAEVEAAIRKTTFMPRLEAAQRAAIAAAGGVEKVPHLKGDLRWTILSAGITLVSLPFIGFLIFVALLLWL